MLHDRYNYYFSFWPIFFPFTSLRAQKIKILKKTPGDIIVLHKGTKKYDQMMYMVHDRWTDGQTDRWTDRRMEKVTYRGWSPTPQKIVISTLCNYLE